MSPPSTAARAATPGVASLYAYLYIPLLSVMPTYTPGAGSRVASPSPPLLPVIL